MRDGVKLSADVFCRKGVAASPLFSCVRRMKVCSRCILGGLELGEVAEYRIQKDFLRDLRVLGG
jgi:hypothetical protein